MNVAYNQISCSDASKVLGVDYSTVTTWCRENKINCVNVSGGSKNGRYVLSEDEVSYIKKLKEKFGKQFMRKYRKDWRVGMSTVENVVKAEPTEKSAEKKPVASIKSMVVNVTVEEPVSKKVDIDEVAIKIGCIQDIKDKLEKLEAEKLKLNKELEDLRREVMEYL